MKDMKPTLGRIVIYNTTNEDREIMAEMPECNVQTQLPAIIVAVWSDECVNLKVMLDGVGDIWRTSVIKGDTEYNWNWPVIEK